MSRPPRSDPNAETVRHRWSDGLLTCILPPMDASTAPVAPLSLSPHPPDPVRRRLTAWVKERAAEHGLAVSAVTSAETFPELEPVLLAHIAAGHVRGLDWFTPDRARFSTAPRNLQASAL